MKVKWLGHAAFLLTSQTGLRVITDPYATGEGLNYKKIEEAADIITVSHDHSDHNYVATVKGKPQVVRTTTEVKGIKFLGLSTYHDPSQGKQRGKNVAFCFALDGVRVCHLGDLGHALSPSQIKELGQVDVLLVPVGGLYTIDAAGASQVCDSLKPKLVIPMHYKTPQCGYPIAGVEEFLKGKTNVRQLPGSEVEATAETLPSPSQIVVLKPAL